jgi:hypothetical protein
MFSLICFFTNVDDDYENGFGFAIVSIFLEKNSNITHFHIFSAILGNFCTKHNISIFKLNLMNLCHYIYVTYIVSIITMYI